MTHQFSNTDAQTAPHNIFNPRVLPAAAMVLLALGCGSMAAGPAGSEHPRVGDKLTTLQLQGLTGDADAVELSDLDGRVALIHFWGTWCPPCVKELPHIEQLNETYQSDPDFILLAISSAAEIYPDVDLLRNETEEFLSSREIDLPTYADVNDRTRSSFERVAGWRGYPATMVIDGDGVIRGAWLEYKDGDVAEMSELIAELLES